MTEQTDAGFIVVVSGPSGAGKTTVCKRLAAECGYPLSVSATTRSPREGEVNGREYFFLTRPEFEAAVARGEFLEHSEHFDNLYGTPRAAVEERTAAGDVILLEIDVNGAAQVMDALPAETWLSIFLTAPDDGENERRLRGRDSDSEASIRTRLQRAEAEKAIAMKYDHHVVNDDLDRTVKTIHDIISQEARQRHGR